MITKTRESYEPRLVSEYVLQRFPTGTIMLDVPLGPIPDQAPRSDQGQFLPGIHRPWRPRADAVVIDNGTLYLIEGKIVDVSLGAGKLPMYARLIPTTPELSQYHDLPVKMILVSLNEAQWSAQAAIVEGIELVIFAPEWALAYLEKRNSYNTGEARRLRLLRKQRLESLGYKD